MLNYKCQGRDATPTLKIKACPQCGQPVEVFSTDTEVACDNCGFVVYNDAIDCVQWCKYARGCVGDEVYEKLMAIAAAQKERMLAEQEAKKTSPELEPPSSFA